MRPFVPRSVKQLQRLLEGIPVGMLTTRTRAGTIHTRPMVMHVADESGWLWLFTDRHSRNACELSQNPDVTVAFQSKRSDRYVSVQGTAVVVRDDVKLQQFRNPALHSWFATNRHDQDIVLLAVRVTRAEYWRLPRPRLSGILGRTKGNHGILDLHPLSV